MYMRGSVAVGTSAMPSRARKPKLPPGRSDTDNSAAMLDAAADALLRKVAIRRGYDVPYLAGYNRRGDAVYIDRHLPRTIKIGRRRVDVQRYVVVHEAIEKAILHTYGLTYQHAHQFAQRAEKELVEADGVGWREYQDAIKRHEKQASDERLRRVPTDLDLEPYRDEGDRAMLAQLRRRIAAERRRERTRAARRRRR
jgi:hypothetical protein